MSIFTEPFLELHFGMDTWQHKPDFLCKITATVIWVHKCSQGDQAWDTRVVEMIFPDLDHGRVDICHLILCSTVHLSSVHSLFLCYTV